MIGRRAEHHSNERPIDRALKTDRAMFDGESVPIADIKHQSSRSTSNKSAMRWRAGRQAFFNLLEWTAKGLLPVSRREGAQAPACWADSSCASASFKRCASSRGIPDMIEGGEGGKSKETRAPESLHGRRTRLKSHLKALFKRLVKRRRAKRYRREWRTDMVGSRAPKSAEEGAETPVRELCTCFYSLTVWVKFLTPSPAGHAGDSAAGGAAQRVVLLS
jgi:hypothetical protein